MTLMTSFGPPLVAVAIFALVYPFVGTSPLDEQVSLTIVLSLSSRRCSLVLPHETQLCYL